MRGWRQLHLRDPGRWHSGRLIAFIAGLITVYLALASPVEAFASFMLSAHMVQHLLLMMLAPPLIWLGWPLFPILRGLPVSIRRYWAVPLLRNRTLQQVFAVLVNPPFAWGLFVTATWLWHVPAVYEFGLANDGWHFIQHACFIVTALLFWYPVVRPYPSRLNSSGWLLFPYLLLADVQNTLLAAWLTFSPRVLYPSYAQVPTLEGISPLQDQQLAGVLMWIPGSIAFLIPLFWIGVRYLFGVEDRSRQTIAPTKASPPSSQARRLDLLTTPLVGRVLSSRSARRTLQVVILLLAALIVFDGLRGPQVTSLNLAGVVPWIHWRGLVVLTLLIGGNFFCMTCPFTLPRTLSRRFFHANRLWPMRLRNKWLAVALILGFLFAYEAFSLWDSPWITAWIILGYFAAAFIVDSFFTGSSFCKYVCPIGQFNFAHSLVSPFEVTVREPATCSTCETRECIRGTTVVPGCQTQLFQPLKQGNLDCTFCLDCIDACPHQNVGVLATAPGRTLWSDFTRSGIGRLCSRPDLAALVIVLTFGAFANAAGMVEPVAVWFDWLGSAMGAPSRAVTISVIFTAALIALPVVTIGLCAALSRHWAGLDEPLIGIASRFAFALVPLGFGMWLSHYGYHFFTSWETIVPALQRVAADFGWGDINAIPYQCECCGSAGDWMWRAQLLMLDGGLLGSLYASFRIAESIAFDTRRAIKAFAPWAGLIILLFAAGVWIVFQPMEMRGT